MSRQLHPENINRRRAIRYIAFSTLVALGLMGHPDRLSASDKTDKIKQPEQEKRSKAELYNAFWGQLQKQAQRYQEFVYAKTPDGALVKRPGLFVAHFGTSVVSSKGEREVGFGNSLDLQLSDRDAYSPQQQYEQMQEFILSVTKAASRAASRPEVEMDGYWRLTIRTPNKKFTEKYYLDTLPGNPLIKMAETEPGPILNCETPAHVEDLSEQSNQR